MVFNLSMGNLYTPSKQFQDHVAELEEMYRSCQRVEMVTHAETFISQFVPTRSSRQFLINRFLAEDTTNYCDFFIQLLFGSLHLPTDRKSEVPLLEAIRQIALEGISQAFLAYNNIQRSSPPQQETRNILSPLRDVESLFDIAFEEFGLYINYVPLSPYGEDNLFQYYRRVWSTAQRRESQQSAAGIDIMHPYLPSVETLGGIIASLYHHVPVAYKGLAKESARQAFQDTTLSPSLQDIIS